MFHEKPWDNSTLLSIGDKKSDDIFEAMRSLGRKIATCQEVFRSMKSVEGSGTKKCQNLEDIQTPLPQQ